MERLTVLAALLLVALPWSALAVAPRLTNLLPPGGQRGTETPVVFSGQHLADAQEVIFYGAGLSAAKLDAGTNQVKVTLKIASDCRIGEHQLRLRTATGISEVRTFWVGALTNLAETEPNSDRAKAQRIPLNCTVHGTIPSEDIDNFIVTAEKGQRLSVEIVGMRLGRAAFDPFIAIHDANGKLLAGSEDSTLGFQDGIAAIIAPASGEYVVQVRDTAYGGQDGYNYRLHVGTFPRPSAAYPPVVQAGQPARIKFVGDVRGEIEQEIPLPKQREEKFGVFAQDEAKTGADTAETGSTIAPTPNWLRVVSFPTVLEAEPNDTREHAGAPRDLPVVFNGIIERAADHDWFRFRAKKGQNVQVAVFARRLRSPLDSAIQVVTAKGAVVAENDDAGGPDSALSFKPDEDGEFSVLIRDHLRRGGHDFVYGLEVAPVEPSLSVKFPDVARNDTQTRQALVVPRGNRFASVISVRRTMAPGDLAIRVDNLPKGLRLLTTSMPGNVDQYPLVFEADSDAPVDGNLADLWATTTNGVSGCFHNDIELVQGPNNNSFYNTRVDHLAAAVTETAPFKLRVIEPKVPLVRGGSMNLQILAERIAGFDEAISVQLLWRPPGLSALPDMTIPQGSNSVLYVLNAKNDADLRNWPIVVLGSAKVHGGDLFVACLPAELTVGEPFLTATIEKSACEPSQATNIVVKLDQRLPFEGSAAIRLLGLSEKIVVSEQQITSADREVIFPVKVDPTCSPGSQRNLFCTVQIPKDGALIPHNIGHGGSFRVVPPKKPTAGGGQKKVATR